MEKKQTEMFTEKCPKCGKVFYGYTEKHTHNQLVIHDLNKHSTP